MRYNSGPGSIVGPCDAREETGKENSDDRSSEGHKFRTTFRKGGIGIANDGTSRKGEKEETQSIDDGWKMVTKRKRRGGSREHTKGTSRKGEELVTRYEGEEVKEKKGLRLRNNRI